MTQLDNVFEYFFLSVQHTRLNCKHQILFHHKSDLHKVNFKSLTSANIFTRHVYLYMCILCANDTAVLTLFTSRSVTMFCFCSRITNGKRGMEAWGSAQGVGYMILLLLKLQNQSNALLQFTLSWRVSQFLRTFHWNMLSLSHCVYIHLCMNKVTLKIVAMTWLSINRLKSYDC